MSDLYKQCTLLRVKPRDQARLVCWLPVDNLKEGMVISLAKQDPDELWLVSAVSKLTLEKDQFQKEWKCGENGEIAEAPPSNFENL